MASYVINCYFNDPNISGTQIYLSSTGVSYYGYYNNPPSVELYTSGFTMFTAEPGPFSYFGRWVYRLGSPTAPQQFSYENPFVYQGESGDIYIRAESSALPQSATVTVYANDPTILNTYISDGYTTNVIPYDGSTAGHVFSYSVGTHLTFTADVVSGGFFKQWVYREGSPTAPQQTSTFQTLTLFANSDLYVRAEGTRLKSFTLSFPNAGIQYTQCNIPQYGLSYGGVYNSADITYGGFNGDEPFQFYATPASGATFDHWSYTLGNSMSLNRSTANPFVYTGSDDIHIYAMSTQSWYQCQSINAQSIQSARYSNLTLQQYGYCMARISFATSGTATIMTTGGLDTMGFMSTSNGVNSELGVPTSYFASADSGGSGDNFSFTVNVSSGRTYYLLVRCKSQLASGYPTLVIYPPGVSPAGTGVFVYTGSVWREVQPYVFDGLAWQKTGANIYTSTGWKQCSS